MSLTGQLSDLSLAELIEFFCNQRKTGRLKVIYPQAPGYFYIQAGSLVDAKIGGLSGVEAVYYALTLPNASFKFSPVFEATRRTIHQPWTQVVLEGLRRIDEGIAQTMAFDENESATADDEDVLDEITESEVEDLEAFKSGGTSSAPLPIMVQNAAAGGRSKGMLIGAAAVAVLASVAIIGVPAGWYGKSRSRVAAAETTAASAAPSTTAPAESASSNSPSASQPEESKTDEAGAALGNTTQSSEASMAARREREARDRERLLRVAEERANASAAKQADANSAQPTAASANLNPTKKAEAPHAAPKAVSVQVTYDEAGRVTQASGGDATALRIARQKRFPAGKPGSTTVTIPIN